MRRGWFIPLVLFAVPTLWWLHDPAWLGDYAEGLRPIVVDENGRAYRWTAGRASFYVPSEWRTTELEIAGGENFGTQASIYVDGRLAGQLQVSDRWETVPVATGMRPTTRRHRRIDIHVARTSEGQNGIRLRWPVREK